MLNSKSLDLAQLPEGPPDRIGWPWTDAPPALPSTMPNGVPWPRISIITPSYNQVAFIEETLRSILLQGYPELEYIVVEGGSTDGTIDIIKRYEPWLSNWMSEPDRGQSNAINKGFQHVSGDIITFCNSDDIYFPGVLADVARVYRENTAIGAISGKFIFAGKNPETDAITRDAYLKADGPVDLTLGPLGRYRIHQASTFFTRQALDDVGCYVDESLHYTMDRELLYRVCRRYRIAISDTIYAAFRYHDASKSQADIIPFSQEFAALHQRSWTGNPAHDRQRRDMARHHRARGYIKLTSQVESVGKRVASLLMAAFYKPSWLFQSGFWTLVLGVLGLRKIAQSMRRSQRV